MAALLFGGRSMKKVWHPYWLWEDYLAGMWSRLEKEGMMEQAIAFTGDHEAYGESMQIVVREWTYACQHNLTCTSMNRLAWIGHAACSLAHGLPEFVVRKAWWNLTELQRNLADCQAQKALDWWINEEKAREIHIQMDGSGIPRRDTRRSTRRARSARIGSILSNDVQSDSEKRFCINQFGLFDQQNT